MSATQNAHEAVRQVVEDLLPGAVVAWDGHEVAVTLDGALVCRVYPSDDATPREAVALVANVVQDSAVERLGRGLPECAGHAHPAVVRQTDDGVAWVCPEDGRTVRAYVVDA